MKRIIQQEVPRDRWDRPRLNGTTYTRASTLAGTLDDKGNLINWSSRMTALGLSRSDDLIQLAATADPNDRARLDDIVERAKDRAGAGSGRDIGTAVHSAAEALDYGEPFTHLPKDLLADARAYQAVNEAMGLTPLLAECFVVNEHLRCAGTFDRLVQREDGTVMVGDIKTVKAEQTVDDAAKWNALKWSIQMAIYAHARPWNGATLDWEDWDLPTPRIDVGIVWVVPRGTGACHAVIVDLGVGLRAANLAAEVRDIRRTKAVKEIHEGAAA